MRQVPGFVFKNGTNFKLKMSIFYTSQNSLFPEPGRVHFAEGINPGVEDRRFHVYFRPLRGEILAKPDVKGKVQVAGPEVNAVIPSQRHLVHIFVENLKTTVLDEPLEQKLLKIEELFLVDFIGDNSFYSKLVPEVC
jgi:hypothetical protein